MKTLFYAKQTLNNKARLPKKAIHFQSFVRHMDFTSYFNIKPNGYASFFMLCQPYMQCSLLISMEVFDNAQLTSEFRKARP